MVWLRSFTACCVFIRSRACWFPIIASHRLRKWRKADESEVLETPEVIISATKTEIPVKQVTSAVEIITGEQMQQRKVRTVVDALRWAQGLAVFQNGGPGALAGGAHAGRNTGTNARIDRRGDRQ